MYAFSIPIDLSLSIYDDQPLEPKKAEVEALSKQPMNLKSKTDKNEKVIKAIIANRSELSAQEKLSLGEYPLGRPKVQLF